MRNFYKNTLLLLSICLFTGCDDYLNINEDPNNATQAPITGLMARTSFESGDNTQNVSSITSFYVQYLASPNEASATDVQEPVAYDQTWFELYDVMTDLSDLEILAEDLGATNYLGVAKILKAYNLCLTIDLWGDIPYSEAFFAQTLNPKYDDDEALYSTVQELLSAGINDLQNDSSSIELGNDDFIFAGDLDKWIKTAHALKARYLLHLSDVPGFSTAAVLAEVASASTSNSDNASVSYFDDAVNPWASVAINNDNLVLGGWISEQIINTMNGSLYGVVDPRMSRMFGTTDAGAFVGTQNGAGRGDAAEEGERSTLVTDSYYAARTAPVNLITFSELKFIEAEVQFRGNNLSAAYDSYLAGIAAHMDELGISTSDKNAYLGESNVAVGSSNINLELILKEKYIALFLNPETWNDARRFDYDYRGFTNPANLNPDLGGTLVRRLIYPESETGRNGDNVPDVTQTTKLWWDQ